MRLEKASSCELPVKPVLLFRHSQTATYRNMSADKTRLTCPVIFMLEMYVIGFKKA
jgi:hypothetical protein